MCTLRDQCVLLGSVGCGQLVGHRGVGGHSPAYARQPRLQVLHQDDHTGTFNYIFHLCFIAFTKNCTAVVPNSLYQKYRRAVKFLFFFFLVLILISLSFFSLTAPRRRRAVHLFSAGQYRAQSATHELHGAHQAAPRTVLVRRRGHQVRPREVARAGGCFYFSFCIALLFVLLSPLCTVDFALTVGFYWASPSLLIYSFFLSLFCLCIVPV